MYTDPTSKPTLREACYCWTLVLRTANLRIRVQEAKLVFGSDDDTHPGIKHLFSVAKDFYVGGKLEAISRLEHYDFLDLRCTSLSFFSSKCPVVCLDGLCLNDSIRPARHRKDKRAK